MSFIKSVWHKLFMCPTFWRLKPAFSCPVCGKKYRCYWDGNDVSGVDINLCDKCAAKNNIELLAAYAHNAWGGWMIYLFSKSTLNEDGSVTIPTSLVDRWKFQAETDYKNLPEDMKPSDRDEARKMLEIMNKC